MEDAEDHGADRDDEVDDHVDHEVGAKKSEVVGITDGREGGGDNAVFAKKELKSIGAA